MVSPQAERAALEQVVKQYLFPLYAGQIAKVEDDIKIFLGKAKTAGLEKVQCEVTVMRKCRLEKVCRYFVSSE